MDRPEFSMTTHARRKPGKPKQGSHAQHGYEFFREFLHHPTKVGAVAPTSERLCRKMIEGVDFKSCKAIVEYGPGTGVLTDAIVPNLAPGTKFFAVELSPRLAGIWRQRNPTLTLYQESAANIAELCRREGVDQIDVIFSGLPWASFPEPLQRQILDATLPMLKPGGKLITFAYQIGLFTPASKRFHRMLPEYFSSFDKSEIVWRNIPPGFALRCTK
jgi:phospholipid N-methyltransferase